MTTPEPEYQEGAELVARVRRAWAPPPDLKVSEFADEHIMVTSGPLERSKWRTDFMPYQRGILDVFFEPGAEVAVLQASSQVGKTTAAVVLVAYHIAHDPCPILVVEPTVDPMAKDFSQNRLDPIIQASPILADAVSKKRQKDSTNTIQAKKFKGGSLSIGGANSAASLASRTIRLLVLDEIDRYPPELPGEGATIEIALKRTTAFGKRRRVALLSSPTVKGAPIDTWFERGDQRRFHVPCPKCGYFFPYQWKDVKFRNKDPATARIHCPDCDYPMGDAERVGQLTKGEWRPTKPDRREKEIVSFHLWEAYSPLSSLSSIVSNFLTARKAQKAGDNSLMHTFQNTTLGEPVKKEAGERVDAGILEHRNETFAAPAPAGVACITAGVDVQDDRLEALVLGWGLGEESWILDRQDLAGDTSNTSPTGPWFELDKLLSKTYRHESGHNLEIAATCIDSGGHRTNEVYDFARTNAGRRVFAIIGRRGGGVPLVSSPSRKKRGTAQRMLPLYTIGVDAAKALWFSRYKITTNGPGRIHIPAEPWADRELAEQLTAEHLEQRYKMGFPVFVWTPHRARNEALDCAVYGLGALKLLHPDFQALLDLLQGRDPEPVKPPPRRPSSGFLGGRSEGWLR